MSNAALQTIMHVLMWKVVPIVILCGAVGVLVREALLRFERSVDRELKSHREGRKMIWAQHIPTGGIDKGDAPFCPSCRITMVKRKSHESSDEGSAVWGCANYPECRETRPLLEERPAARLS